MKVLVAVDNRPSSQASMDALVKMHWYEGTEIDLVTVFPSAQEAAANSQDVDAYAELEGVVDELRTSLRQCEISFFVRYGDAKTEILNLAQEVGADLIVSGSNCKSTLERLLLGSVSQSLLNNARCPVIVAKTPCCLAREASPGFRNILVPIDNSIYSDIAVQWLANFSWAPNTRFIIVAVVDTDTDLRDVEQSLENRAWNLSRLLNTENIGTEIETGDPQQSILNLAKKYYADLIVMGSHGHTGLKELLLGSVAHAVSHAAPCAVAIVRGPEIQADHSRGSGAFKKAKPVAQKRTSSSSRLDEGRNEGSVHIIPAGF